MPGKIRNKTPKKAKRWCVYAHINKFTQESYIGITDDKHRRWRDGEGYKTSPKFYSAIKRYGWKNFYHITILDNLTEKQAKEKEKYYIDKFNSIEKGYNMRRG